MANWKGIVGKSFDIEGFKKYCETLKWDKWKPQFVVLHNTGSPNLKQRPNGLQQQHIANLENYYKNNQKWSAGPHLFIDDRQIWVFSPLTAPGVHSPSWNSISLGIEMLGDYSDDKFNEGRGQKVHDNATAAIAILSHQIGLDPHSIKLHKEDPKTNHNCPGKNVKKEEVIQDVVEYISTLTK